MKKLKINRKLGKENERAICFGQKWAFKKYVDQIEKMMVRCIP